MFTEYFGYQIPSLLLKDLYNFSGNISWKIANHANNALINLGNGVNRKEIPNNENPEELIEIVEEILIFNKPQKGKGLPLNFDHANLKVLNKCTLHR